MKATELLLVGLVGWTAIGVLGVGVSAWRGERQKVRRGVAWLAGVWVVYLCVLEHFLFYCRLSRASLNQAFALPAVMHGRASVMA